MVTKKTKPTKTLAAPKPTKSGAADLSHIVEGLRPLALPLGKLNEDPKNARRHPERNLQATVNSLRRFGQRKPVVVNRNGMVIEAGNGTYAAAKQLGWSHIAVVLVDDDPTTAAGYAIADNRTAELAEWDYASLADLVETIKADEEELLGEIGWDTAELDMMLNAEWEPAAPAGDIGDFRRNDSKKHVVVFSDKQWEVLSALVETEDQLAPKLVELAQAHLDETGEESDDEAKDEEE